MTATLPLHVVILVAANGSILTHFETDRDEFPTFATYDRDRIFTLAFSGALTGLDGMVIPNGVTIFGAVYSEVEAWRISGRTIRKPRPKRLRNARVFNLAKFRTARAGGAR